MTNKQRKQFARMWAASMLWHAAESWESDERLNKEDVVFISNEVKKLSTKMTGKDPIRSGQQRILDYILTEQGTDTV